MSPYLLKILLPDKKIYNHNIISMTIPCENGPLTVLAGHAPMTAMLVEGSVIIKTEQETLEAIIGQGILQVGKNTATVMVYSFKWSADESEEEVTEETGKEDLML